MPTIIAFHPSGFEIRFDVTPEDVPTMIAKLTQRQYRSSRALVYTAEGLPICPKHGVPMQKREKQGDTWYSHKVPDPVTGEVTYCRGYAAPSSPGYAIEPDKSTPASAKNDRKLTGTNHHMNPVKPTPRPKQGNGHPQQERPLADLSLDELNQALFG
ncbi:MAG: hypothetical protein GY934_11115 [Gammaproteobacteria bacterium]|nr:hypothetical protein [Gammaproteobacteria bacterium]